MNKETLQKLSDLHFYKTDMEGEWEEGLFYPTLSELIEACGEDFKQLNKFDDGSWHARNRDDTKFLNGEGSTPEEALANLWISLHTIDNDKDIKTRD